MKPEFFQRAQPLPPRAVVGLDRVSAALARRLLARPDEELRQLRVLVSPALLVALAPAELLPWVDGALYLGSDDRAPALLMPTTQEPTLHPQLIERALRRLDGAQTGQLAVLPSQGKVVSLRLAAPPSRARLQAWLEARA